MQNVRKKKKKKLNIQWVDSVWYYNKYSLNQPFPRGTGFLSSFTRQTFLIKEDDLISCTKQTAKNQGYRDTPIFMW